MKDFYKTKNIPCFGVAGNFTGHLEQAGEAADFKNVKTAEQNAPKAVFPTFLPLDMTARANAAIIPQFLTVFPFDAEKIIFPKNEEKLQIEPECAIVFNAVWNADTLIQLEPVCFGASNDCSIRKQGAKKISEKKNWGIASKGFSKNLIQFENEPFTLKSKINDYRIASFLLRNGEVYIYGEDSAVRGYSYFYEKLISWLLEKFNTQKNEGPAEDIHSYLIEAERPSQIMVSVGATRYTDWGEHNFLQSGDTAIVAVYPESKYTIQEICALAKNPDALLNKADISALVQTVTQ